MRTVTLVFGVLLTLCSIVALAIATLIVMVLLADCSVDLGLLGEAYDDCEEVWTRTELFTVFVIASTLTAPLIALVGRLAGLSWRSSLATGWLAAFGALALTAIAISAASPVIFVAILLLYAAAIALIWRWRHRKQRDFRHDD